MPRAARAVRLSGLRLDPQARERQLPARSRAHRRRNALLASMEFPVTADPDTREVDEALTWHVRRYDDAPTVREHRTA
jgi:hypothetical protein